MDEKNSTKHDFFENAKSGLAEIENIRKNGEERLEAQRKKDEQNKAKQEKAQQELVVRQLPDVLQQGREILAWIDDNLFQNKAQRAVLERIFTVKMDIFWHVDTIDTNFWICWDYPGFIRWKLYRKWSHDQGSINSPEELAKLGSDVINKFHKHLYGGTVWKWLEVDIQKKLLRFEGQALVARWKELGTRIWIGGEDGQ